MATIKKGVLGSFSGKFGNLEGYSINNVSIIRSRKDYIPSPGSTAQMVIRSRFTFVNNFYFLLQQAGLDAVLELSTGIQTPIYKFQKWNNLNFSSTALINPSGLTFSQGRTLRPEGLHVHRAQTINGWYLDWIPNADNVRGYDNDTFVGLLINYTRQLFHIMPTGVYRSVGRVQWSQATGWLTPDVIWAYGFFIKNNSLAVSNTTFANYPGLGPPP